MIRRRLRITGRVQGVCYRAWLVEEANSLRLDGWVRNRADGSVEAVVQGAPAAVTALVARCHEGPPAARIARVDVGDDPDAEVLAGFEQRGTL